MAAGLYQRAERYSLPSPACAVSNSTGHYLPDFPQLLGAALVRGGLLRRILRGKRALARQAAGVWCKALAQRAISLWHFNIIKMKIMA